MRDEDAVAPIAAMNDFGFWSAGLCAFAFFALAIWLVRRTAIRRTADKTLVAALLLTAAWGVAAALAGPASVTASLVETLRNAGWLAFLYAIFRRTGKGPATVGALMGVLLYILMGLGIWDALRDDPIGPVEASLRMLFAIGALVLVHNLYHLAEARRQEGMALALATLAAMWTYDLGLYFFAVLPDYGPGLLLPARGMAIALMAPVLALALRDSRRWRFALSHQAAFRFASIGLIALYLGVVVIVALAVDRSSGAAAAVMLFLLSLAALPSIPSDRLRATLKVVLAKHFFRHRYDYREQWVRFADTVGRPDGEGMTLGARVAKALADVLGASGGMVLLRTGTVSFRIGGRWKCEEEMTGSWAEDALDLFEQRGFIADCDAIRDGSDALFPASWLPPGLSGSAWLFAIVPLVHLDRLVGLALLGRPPIARSLDWEDFDILRVAGRQAASYLAEAEGQARLVEARQFEEFNRRFAFVMHDIKNVVSQLALLARNAERHAENPDFRADMIATLKGSSAKMQELLARLDGKGALAPAARRPVLLSDVVRDVVPAAGGRNPVELNEVERGLAVSADPDRLRTILIHLLTNAVEASRPGVPIRFCSRSDGETVRLDLIDQGCGMDEAFLADSLFRPFQSSKQDGFGIGAYEARTLARAMGGDVTATSRAGEGSVFTVSLPAAPGQIRKEAA